MTGARRADGVTVPWAAHGSRFTREFEEMTGYLAQRMDRTAVCLSMGIDWRTAGTTVARIVEERLDPQRLENLYVIGVDEISFRRHHSYLTVVVGDDRHVPGVHQRPARERCGR